MKRYALIFAALLLLTFCNSLFAQTNTGVEALLKKSAEYARQDKLGEAAAEVTKAIAIQPDNADLYLRRADLYRFLDKKELLAEDVNKAAALSPDNKQVILTAARLLRITQQCTESLSILNAYTFKNGENDEVIFSRSQSNICLGDWASAYQDASKAGELNPDKSHYRTTQASLLAKLGDGANSAEQLNQSIESLEAKLAKTTNRGERESVKRDLAGAYRARAGVSRSKADTAAEFADLAKLIEHSPTDFSYRMRASSYRDRRMYEEAIADYTEAIRLSPANFVLVLERGDVFAAAKRYEEALNDYEQSLQLNPTLKAIVEQKINDIKSQSKKVK